jgi:2-iminobutanoate/2-iminopropanoate deaminase
MGAASLMAGSSHAATKESSGVRKLSYDGKPADGTGFITPLIVHNGVIYIAGQGAHSRNPN